MASLTILPTITAIIALVPAAVASWLKLREVLAPLLARRSLRVALVADEDGEQSAGLFADSLRKQGYRKVYVTRDSSAVLGMQAVVLWTPSRLRAPGALSAAQQVAPSATVLLLTYERLEGVQLAPRVLLSNSEVRLRSDLSAVAEATR